MSRTGDSYSTRCGNGTSHSSCLDSSERELCKQQLREVQHQVDWTSIQGWHALRSSTALDEEQVPHWETFSLNANEN
ncbi:hypothetical protein MRX96_010147 [Rhipicephalus microplus]